MYDTYCEIMEVPPPPTQILPNDAQVAFTQMVDVATESLPQGIFQTAVLLSASDSSWLQLVSVLASLLTTAYISAASGLPPARRHHHRHRHIHRRRRRKRSA